VLSEPTIVEAPVLRKGLAWTSLVLGVLSIVTLGFFAIGAIGGILIGAIAVSRARREPDRYGGGSLATAGIALNVISLLLAIFAVLAVIFLVQPVKVEGSAMRPTLNNGDKILLGKQIKTIDRGDIVAFWFPDDPSKSFIKRVVGLPTETIRIDMKGVVYINGDQIAEPYVLPEHSRFPRAYPETTVKPHAYFVMGDNRDQSNDSRSWGLVPEKYIYGKFIGRYYSAN
jgi:signal peptidase I